MFSVFLSIVSHNNEELIIENFFKLKRDYESFQLKINVIDNIGSETFKKICEENQVNYYSDSLTRGYGENNNKNFELINPDEEDVFIVCNPDVLIQENHFEVLISDFISKKADIYGVKVYESKDLTIFSSHNRSYPALLDPIISLILKKKLFENDPDVLANPDWIGGAFMVFKPKSFERLKGFDDRFFMYYEDVDICRRAKKLNMKIVYNPNFYIVHEAQREGRKFLSSHFKMNLTSMIKYFFRYPTLRFISLNKLKK